MLLAFLRSNDLRLYFDRKKYPVANLREEV